MKVRLKVQKEINGELALPGWVFGVDEPTGWAWIAAGEAEQVADEVRSLKYAPTAPLMTVCVDPADAAPAEPRDARPFSYTKEKY